MRKNKKTIIISLLLLISFILYMTVSYYGLLFFKTGYNELDYLIFNIVGDSFFVGIVTYISTKSISLFISKKEFQRNHKINISINDKKSPILHYSKYLELCYSSNVYFGLDSSDSKLFNSVFEIYIMLKNILINEMDDSIMENILNIPFSKKYFADDDLNESYKKILNDFSKDFHNVRVLKALLDTETIKKLNDFSNKISNLHHFEIVNLNSNEGCQILFTANNKVVNKISCLPNQKYDLYVYFNSDKWLQFLAFTYDYDGNEEAVNLMGMKYTNKKIKERPISIDLDDYINVRNK